MGVPQAEAVCRHCLQILTTETIKIRKFRTIYLLILDQYVSGLGLSDPLGGGNAPSPRLTPHCFRGEKRPPLPWSRGSDAFSLGHFTTHPQMRRGNTFGRVCLSVCMSSGAQTFESLGLVTSFVISRRYAFRIFRSRSNIKVMISRSRSYERSRLHTCTCALPSAERKSCFKS